MNQEDTRRGVTRYIKFHGKEPRNIEPFNSGLKIPERIGFAGKALFSTYRCDKLNGTDNPGEVINYAHDHEAGTQVYVPGGRMQVRVPPTIQKVQTLVRLGKCLGIGYRDADGNEMEGLGTAGTELFCTPDGHALLVISNKRRLEAMIWGGKLRVLERGIVG